MSRRFMLILAIFFLVGAGLVAWSLYVLLHQPAAPVSGVYDDYTQSQVTIKGVTLHAAVANTTSTRAQGLSGRPSMAPDDAMLFIFPIPAKYSFWMKDMHFPLDMVWIRKGIVVDISKDVPAPVPGASLISLPTFAPSAAIDSVLEVNAGLAAKYGWETGDPVAVAPNP